MINFSIIVAAGLQNEIGYNNQLLCHLPADLRHFKTLTTGHPIVMGRHTWESLPIKPLPNRTNLVLSRNSALSLQGATVIHSLEEVCNFVDNEEDVFIIGGEKVYRDALPVANTLYLTRIQHTFEADAFFPTIDENKWHLVEDNFYPHDEKNGYDMNFQKWIRKA
jgi:dihydrofolate reductase